MSSYRGPSLSAQMVAAHRAFHLTHDRPTIFEDAPAIWLLAPPLSTILRSALLRRLWERVVSSLRPVGVFVVVRSRYAEDGLEHFIGQGCRQYVVLGAGLDSWALRHAPSGVSVFELDQPATQRWKLGRIIARLGRAPSHLNLVPIDFEREAIADVLSGGRYDRGSLAFVSWLGTVYYLTRAAIEKTCASLAVACAPGSRVVFDYWEPPSTMSPTDGRLLEALGRANAPGREPLRTLLTPGEVAVILQAAGFRVVEDLAAPEIRRRYLHGRTDGLDIPGFARLCCAEREGAARGAAGPAATQA